MDPDQEVLEQYALRGDIYDLVQKSSSGEVRSTVIPGFCVPVRAFFDPEAHLQALRAILAEPA